MELLVLAPAAVVVLSAVFVYWLTAEKASKPPVIHRQNGPSRGKYSPPAL
jgi:hypothetical protein